MLSNKIENVSIEILKPYEGNSKRHTKKQIQHIKNSIKQFGMIDPIGIDENNLILEGHGRLKALKEMGAKTAPCIRITGLSDEEKRGYNITHNFTNKETGFDDELFYNEIDSITGFDMSDFGIDMDKAFDNLFKENERIKTNTKYNLDLVDIEHSTKNFWQMPIIKNDNYIPSDLIGFNYAKTNKEKNVGVHFYLDDYQFERVWNTPSEYVDILKQYECVLSPDFSLYMDMPMPMKIWNIYRSRQIGQYWQKQGIKVIPTISWAEKETFDFCFEGIPKGSIVSISTIGVKRNKTSLKVWNDGVTEMIERIKPAVILVYGGKLDYDYGNIEVKYYENKVTERFKK